MNHVMIVITLRSYQYIYSSIHLKHIFVYFFINHPDHHFHCNLGLSQIIHFILAGLHPHQHRQHPDHQRHYHHHMQTLKFRGIPDNPLALVAKISSKMRPGQEYEPRACLI